MAVKNNIVPPKPVNIAVSGSSGYFDNYYREAILPISCTITTGGKPIFVMLQPDGTSGAAYYGCYTWYGDVKIYNTTPNIVSGNGTNQIAYMPFGALTPYGTWGSYLANNAPGSISLIDEQPAGTYTYYVGIIGGGSPPYYTWVNNLVIVAVELT